MRRNRQYRLIDLTGTRFGNLTVLARSDRAGKNDRGAKWKCICDCGKEIVTRSQTLRKCDVTSCGCKQRQALSERSLIDLSGKQFGKLTVLSRFGSLNPPKWKCVCDCGTSCVVLGAKLRTLHTQSCGCLKRQATSERRLIDLTGKKAGCWTVKSRQGTNKNGQPLWLCVHENGETRLRPGASISTYLNPERKIVQLCRRRMVLAFKSQSAKRHKGTMSLIGCTGKQLVAHLRSKFAKGMTIENHGKVWHIDHIKPVSKFNLLDPSQVELCFHFSNLQPLFAKENIKKSNR